MGTLVWVLVFSVVVVVIAVLAFTVFQRRKAAEGERRSTQLRDHFGPEYDRAVQAYGSPQAAEPVLLAREERVKTLDIRPLSADEQTRFASAWQAVQAQFVDDPAAAVGAGDALIAQVMETRGYPVGDFERQASTVSVNHPEVVENYRAGHAIALRQEAGQASTEDLRQAMVHYRALFRDLLETPQTNAVQTDR